MLTRIRLCGRRLAVGITMVVAGFVIAAGGTAIATAALTNGDQVVIQQLSGATTRHDPAWAVNSNGQTYGSLLNSTSSASDPELVQVIATNGKTGYVYSSQLNPPAPASPSAAIAQEEANTAGLFIPVYAQDGTTVIGQFEVAEPGNAAG